jgi:hypothetical protein
MNSLAEGSIPDEGSSNKIMCGLPNIAIATYSLRLFPPDKNLACFSSYDPSYSFYIDSLISS